MASNTTTHTRLVRAALAETEFPDLPPLQCGTCHRLCSYGGADWAHTYTPEDACTCERLRRLGDDSAGVP